MNTEKPSGSHGTAHGAFSEVSVFIAQASVVQTSK